MDKFGKLRGISHCSNEAFTFNILALDHRNNLRKVINPTNPSSVSFNELVKLKRPIIKTLAPYTSAILVDPQYGVASSIISNIFPKKTGLIVALESSGYQGKTTERKSRILPYWSVGKIKRMGADAVKLLIYYHPESRTAIKQEELVEITAEECSKYDISLFLEILTHSVNPNERKLTSLEKCQVIISAIEKFTLLGVALFKLEFPINIDEISDESAWGNACKKVSNIAKVPWTLLSANVDYETFVKQTRIACKSGASGVIAGRAIWKEIINLDEKDKDYFLYSTAKNRLITIKDLCIKFGKPWIDYFPEPCMEENWYLKYSDL